ncbi:hypothetical protein B0H14DRAFT_2633176 [Mycena olivaceomarginata]|nr:hypothetical protein B0H14DRAFT_2633176 [Mycena olivaceomarginata]
MSVEQERYGRTLGFEVRPFLLGGPTRVRGVSVKQEAYGRTMRSEEHGGRVAVFNLERSDGDEYSDVPPFGTIPPLGTMAIFSLPTCNYSINGLFQCTSSTWDNFNVTKCFYLLQKVDFAGELHMGWLKPKLADYEIEALLPRPKKTYKTSRTRTRRRTASMGPKVEAN